MDIKECCLFASLHGTILFVWRAFAIGRRRAAAALESALVPRVKDLNLARIENTRGATVLQVRRPTSRARARDPNSRPPKPSPSFRAKDGENNLVRESEFPIKQSTRD